MSPKLNHQTQQIFNGSLVQAELSAQRGAESDTFLEATCGSTRLNHHVLSHPGVEPSALL